MDEEQIAKLKLEIELLKSQWPAHSVPPAMLIRLDELEESLEMALKSLADDQDNDGSS